MKIIGTLAILGILYLIFRFKGRNIRKIPVLKMDPSLKNINLEEYYDLDFTYVTTDKGRDLFIKDHFLYIIRGKSDVAVRLSLYDGDCILVDTNVKEVKNEYKAYLVDKYPMFSAYKGEEVLPKSDITKDTRIIGALVSKIPADYIKNFRKL